MSKLFKLLFILLLMVGFVLTTSTFIGCEEDSSTEPEVSPAVGNWTMIAYTYEGETYTPGSEYFFTYTMTFIEGGTGNGNIAGCPEDGWDGPFNLTWTLSGLSLTVNVTGEGARTYNGTMTEAKIQFTTSFDGRTFTFNKQ